MYDIAATNRKQYTVYLCGKHLVISLICLYLQAEGAGVKDICDQGLFDLYLAKYWGLKFATTAACTVLKVDQVTSHFNYRHLIDIFS